MHPVIQEGIVSIIQEGTPMYNCYKYIADRYDLRYNVVTGNVENTRVKINGHYQIIDDMELNSMYVDVCAMFTDRKEKVSKDLITSYIFSNKLPLYNPFMDFIDKNKHIERSEQLIKKLADCIPTNTMDAYKYIKHWGCGMIASIYGSQSPLTLVLAGEKLNTGKTEFFRRLLPDELKYYYTESSLDAGKDDDILMCRKLIIMDDEFGGKSKRDQKHFKKLTSKQGMSIRLPYGRTATEMRRLCSLCGTSNDMELLSDPSGNRRILPIHVIDNIDKDTYNSIDKSALFMAFYDVYASGFHWKFKQEDIEALNRDSEDFISTNSEQESILMYFELPNNDSAGELMTATAIRQHIELFAHTKITNIPKFSAELKKLGFKQTRKWINGIQHRLYRVVKLSSPLTTPDTNFYKPVEDQF